MGRNVTKAPGPKRDLAQQRAESLATVRVKKLEEENEALRRQLQALAADNERLEARALAAEEQRDLYKEEIADLRTELQSQLAINESRGHQINMLIHARDATQALPRKVGVPVSYEKTDYDALVIRDIYDLNKLKSAIGILISDGLWHCKYWFALFRLFSDHKVLTYACSAAVFAQWAEASFPTAGTNIANSMKSFQRYCKAKSVESWINDGQVIKANRVLARRVVECFLDGQGEFSADFRTRRYYDPTRYE